MLEKVNFNYTKDITVVNKDQFEAHKRLYEGYITKINEIDAQLHSNPQWDKANSTYSHYRALKRGETFALDGVILHELYFENIGGRMGPDKVIMDYIEIDFGSFQNWMEDFIATAKSSRGWAILLYDQRTGRLRNISLDAHDYGNIAYSIPFLILDMYEHAYFLQYADNKAEYINQFMKNIDWGVVGERMNS